MGANSSSRDAQVAGWRMLKGLHPTPIDLQRVHLIRAKTGEYLSRSENIERLLLDLGLNDEGMGEFPSNLHRFCGPGLRVWQYPTQFSRYLAQLSRLRVRSYLELGIRHGGSFVTTVEILERFSPLEFAVGVDIIPCPSMTEYKRLNPRVEFVCINTQGADFGALIERIKPIDLIFIDSHHEESQCRREFTSVNDSANMVAFHDISNVNCPGVAKVWNEVKAAGVHECFEYNEQYEGMGPYMGIGLAVRKERFPDGDARNQWEWR